MILHSLRLKPMHGYALVKHIKLSPEYLLQIEEGSLYPALQRMLKEGWLDSNLVSLLGLSYQDLSPDESAGRRHPGAGDLELRKDVRWFHSCALHAVLYGLYPWRTVA